MTQILNEFGNPIASPTPAARRDLHALAAQANGARRPAINARFDAASDSDEFKNYWAAADHLDADSAHSPGVRRKLVARSRYEVGNNGYADGIVQTICNYLISTGPVLQMKTPDKAFNEEVEQAWASWAKKTQLRRKLWCMAHAKVQDGEAFGLLRQNPRMKHPVQLDLRLVETEQCTTPYLPHFRAGYVDGIRFDEWGNAIHYDILPAHPGGAWTGLQTLQPEHVPARFVAHWFLMRRPGQHRAVPEFRSTLNVGASARRWREATVSAAETAASISAMFHTDMPADDPDDAPEPLSTIEIARRMGLVMPDGYDVTQMRSEHPNSTFEMFHRAGINEQARPKSVPYNLAACDSSSYNFSSAKLDGNNFHAALDCERLDCDDLVMDQTLFAQWWRLAVPVYGWDAEPDELPPHRWAWPKYPVGDIKAHAITNDTRLSNGSCSLSRLYEEEGRDFEEELPRMAADYGVTPEEMRQILLKKILGGPQATPAKPDPPDDDDDGDDVEEPPFRGKNGVNAMGRNGSRLNGFPAIHAANAKTDADALPPIDLLADVEILAAEEAPAGEKAKPRAFRVQAYNGGMLRVNRWSLPVVVDLAGLTFAKSITANLHHEVTAIVGHITDKQKSDADLVLAGVVSGTGVAAQEFIGNHDNGYPWQASIEALPSRVVNLPEGKTAEVNGQTFTGPIQIARKSKLHGIAFLPRGADEDTSVTIAATAAQEEHADMDFEQWIAAMSLDVAVLTDQQKAALKTKYDAEIKAAQKPVVAPGPGNLQPTGTTIENAPPILAAPAFDIDDIKSGFSELSAEIEAKFAMYEDDVRDKKTLTEIRATAWKEAKALKATALNERWVEGRFEVEAIKAANKVEVDLLKAQSPKGPSIHASNADLSNEVIEASICLTLGMEKPEEQFKEETLEAAHKHYRNIGLQQVLIMAAAANGYHASPGQRISNGNLREVLQHAFSPIHAAPSTLSLPGIFSNVANKNLLMGYMEEDQTWREVASTATVNDFKTATSYRLTDNMEYEAIGQDGKIAHGELGEESYTRQADTYAKMFALTRKDIINDDLGAFDDLRGRLGSGAARKFNRIFWQAFLSLTHFTEARGNYSEGAGTALGLDGTALEAAILLFRTMKSPEGKRMGGRPTKLLVPPELEHIADKLYTSTHVNTGGASTKNSVPNANTHLNKYKPVVSDWLSDDDFDDASGTGWYLLRDPKVLAALVVSFLNGVQTPTVESSDADFDTLGVQFRGYHDFGVDAAEPLAGVKIKGAA